MLRALVIMAAVGLTFPASATEQLFTGSVQKIVMRQHGVDGCPPVCGPAAADGSIQVCVSNSAGCQSTEIKVQDVFIGDARPGSIITVDSSVGEWSEPVFYISPKPVLVLLHGDAHEWADIKTKRGKLYFKTARHLSIGGVPTRSLRTDADGMASLEELLARIRAAR